MKAIAIRYLNEIVGLTVMALMAVALVAGEADATVHQSVRGDTAYEATELTAGIKAVMEATTIHADLEIQVDLDQVVDAAGESDTRDAIRELIRIKLHQD
jgi:hypothetical protein